MGLVRRQRRWKRSEGWWGALALAVLLFIATPGIAALYPDFGNTPPIFGFCSISDDDDDDAGVETPGAIQAWFSFGTGPDSLASAVVLNLHDSNGSPSLVSVLRC